MCLFELIDGLFVSLDAEIGLCGYASVAQCLTCVLGLSVLEHEDGFGEIDVIGDVGVSELLEFLEFSLDGEGGEFDLPSQESGAFFWGFELGSWNARREQGYP